MKRGSLRLIWVGLLAGFGTALGGCGGEKTGEAPPTYQNLQSISAAYLEATNSQDRPPSDLNELTPFLKKRGDPNALLKGTDGEALVIIYGVDYRTAKLQDGKLPVTAYEKTGQGGKRYVLQIRTISRVSDEEFRQLPFPPGHKLPS
jgi:hypothetical protein